MHQGEVKIYIGTSGWSYSHWSGKFYPENWPKSRWFEYYISIFGTVEINATFYRTFRESTYEKWYRQAPEPFRYVLKAPKIITHRKYLINVADDINAFWQKAALLKEKLGAILLQLAPSTPYDPERLQNALRCFPFPGKIAVEFRHRRWLTEEVFSMLKERGCIFCNIDSPRLKIMNILTAETAYIRLHGHTTWYNYFYSDDELRELAEKINDLAASGAKLIYVFFNNDTDAYAVQNALKLKELLSQSMQAGVSPEKRIDFSIV